MNRILLIVAVVCFLIAALSAFSDDINVNELGFIALGLTAYAAAPLVADYAVGGPRVGRGRRLVR
jgi:hypothetical protein